MVESIRISCLALFMISILSFPAFPLQQQQQLVQQQAALMAAAAAQGSYSINPAMSALTTSQVPHALAVPNGLSTAAITPTTGTNNPAFLQELSSGT